MNAAQIVTLILLVLVGIDVFVRMFGPRRRS